MQRTMKAVHMRNRCKGEAEASSHSTHERKRPSTKHKQSLPKSNNATTASEKERFTIKTGAS